MEWIPSRTVKDLDIAEEDLTVRIRTLDGVVLGLERWIKMYGFVGVHQVELATVFALCMAIDAVRHHPTVIHC